MERRPVRAGLNSARADIDDIPAQAVEHKLSANDFRLALGVALLAFALRLPFYRFISSIGDEGILLRGATEILSRRVLYRDFFEFHPPGGFLITVAWLGATGVSVGTIRLLAMQVAAAIAGLIFACCRACGVGRWLSAVMAIVWVIGSQGLGIQVNHHLMTTAMSLGAMLALLSAKGRARGAWAGLFVGAACMITPNRGVYAAMAATAMLGFSWPALIAFLAGLSVFPALCVIYVVANGAVQAAWSDVIGWTASNYAGVQARPFGADWGPETLPLAVAFPAAAVLAMASSLNSPGIWRERNWRTAAAFALAGLAGSFPRPDVAHLTMTVPLVFPLLALGAAKVTTALPRLAQTAVVSAVVVFAAVPPAIYYGALSWAVLNAKPSETPRGAAVFLRPSVGEMIARVAFIPKSDGVLFYPYMPLIPVLTAREHVASVDIFLPGYTTPQQYADACREVSTRARWVVFDRAGASPDGLKSVFPALKIVMPPERARFERALAANFTTVWRNSQFDVMRRSGAGAMDCT